MKIYLLKKPFIISPKFGFWIIAIILLYSCGNNTTVVLDSSLLEKYNSLSNPLVLTVTSDTIDCYLDYSNGMAEGMNATLEINNKLKGRLGGLNVNYYKVGASSLPTKIEDINSPTADFTIATNYSERGSKLKIAVDSIVSHKDRTSVYITDFEKVDDVSLNRVYANAPAAHPIDVSPWAQKEFKEWLQSGNQIDIFAAQFMKPDYWFDKTGNSRNINWIYTLIFTPNYVINDENLFETSVLKFMLDQYRQVDTSLHKHYTFSAHNFKIEQLGQDDAAGNANDNVVVQENITSTKDKNFEYYLFESSDLINFITDETLNDKRIINKIKISSENTCFADVVYGINVYDVTSSLTEYYTFLNQPDPEIQTNTETGEKDTIGYVSNKFNYQKGTPVEDIFDLVYNTDTKEIGIKLKPDFTGVSQNTIYQIDVAVNSAMLKDFSEENNILKLNYRDNYSIASLGESLGLAMRDASTSLKNKVLYTIFIKICK